jgi:hypothetical protein
MSTIFSDTTGRQLIKTKKLATWADLIGSNRFRPTPDQIRADQNPSERFFTGRDGLIEEVVGHAKNFKPVALIGPGGIGKISIALAVLQC